MPTCGYFCKILEFFLCPRVTTFVKFWASFYAHVCGQTAICLQCDRNYTFPVLESVLVV